MLYPAARPWDRSVADPLSGHRTVASLLFRSSSAACGTCTLKDVTSLVAGGSTICEAFFALSWALIGIRPADNKAAPPVMAVCMNRRRFSELCMMYSSLMKLRSLNSREYYSAKLEHQERACLRNGRVCPSYLVEAILNASRVEIPTCGDGDVLFTVNLK